MCQFTLTGEGGSTLCENVIEKTGIKKVHLYWRDVLFRVIIMRLAYTSWILVICLPSITRLYWFGLLPFDSYTADSTVEILTEWFVLLPIVTFFYIGFVTSQGRVLDELKTTLVGIRMEVTRLIWRIATAALISYFSYRVGRVLVWELLHSNENSIKKEMLRSLTLRICYLEPNGFTGFLGAGICAEIFIHALILVYYALLIFVQLSLYTYCYNREAKGDSFPSTIVNTTGKKEDRYLTVNQWRLVMVAMLIIFTFYHTSLIFFFHPPHLFFLQESYVRGSLKLSPSDGVFLDFCNASILPLMVAACGLSAAFFRRRLVELLS